MALNTAMLKNPKVLIVVAVGIVGGVYLSSQIKKRAAAKSIPPTEVTPSVQTVIGSDNLQLQDQQNRDLAAAQQKLAELEEKNRQQQLDYANSTDTERSRYQDQLSALGLSLSNQYTSQIESLKRQIADLQTRASTVPAVAPLPTPGVPSPSIPAPGVPVPLGDPSRTPATSTPAPTPAPVTTVATPENYTPGYGINYRYNCDLVPQHNNTLSWDEFVQNEKNKNIGGGWNNTAQQRNLAQIAISGTASKGVQTKGSMYGPVTITNTNRIYTNNVRAAWGLRPLTAGEWVQAQAFMSSLWNGDENAQVFQSGQYAKAVFERYNLPYRCPVSRSRIG